MGFPFEVCSLYGFAAECVAPFLFLIGTKGSILNITKKEEVEQRVLGIEPYWTEDNVSGGLTLKCVFNPLSPARAEKTVPDAGELNFTKNIINIT